MKKQLKLKSVMLNRLFAQKKLTTSVTMFKKGMKRDNTQASADIYLINILALQTQYMRKAK